MCMSRILVLIVFCAFGFNGFAADEIYKKVDLTAERKDHAFNLAEEKISGADVLIPGREGADFFIGVDWQGKAWCKPVKRDKNGDNFRLRLKVILDPGVGDGILSL